MTIVAFLLACSLAHAAEDRELVRVNGTPIRQSEVVERLLQRYGDQTLDEMIDELLLRQEAQKEGIKAPPAEIDRRFSRMKAQFSDPRMLEAQLEQYGSSVDKLKQDIGEQISREKVVLARRKLDVTEDDLRQAFALHKDDLGTPEAVHLQHLLAATQAEADAAVKAFPGGTDYGWVSKGMLPPQVEDVAFAMKPGEVKVVPSSKGFHVLRVVEHRAAVPAQFSRVKDDLRQLLLQEKIKRALPDVVRELRQKAEIVPQAH